MQAGARIHLWLFLFFLLAAQVFLWTAMRPIKPRWANVPPVPSVAGFTAFALGDPQFAYRIGGLILQNLGNTGGRTQKFETYDYDRLGNWFSLSRKLDARSNFVPYLAAYYFGAVEEPAKLKPLVRYL